MYFWKVESLKKDIVDGSFTDKKLIPYVVLSVGIYALGNGVAGYLPCEDVNIWNYILSILNVMIPIVGTIYAYKCNGGGNGKNFASKYISIGFVVGIRFLVYLIPLMVLIAIYGAVVFGEKEELPTTYVEVILFSAWYSLLYYKTAKHISDTAKE
jgi:hypothetical protein